MKRALGKEFQGLTAWERAAFLLILAAAEDGLPAPTAIDLQEACGCSSVSTTVNLVRALERRGLITVERYQRARLMTIVETGKATAPVKNRTPHWRTVPRPAAVPSIASSHVQRRRPQLADAIGAAARSEGLSVQDFLVELVWAGWRFREGMIQADDAADVGSAS